MNNEYCVMLNKLRQRNKDGLSILAMITAISEKRLNEIADGASPTISEEIILEAHR